MRKLTLKGCKTSKEKPGFRWCYQCGRESPGDCWLMKPDDVALEVSVDLKTREESKRGNRKV